MKLSFAKAGGRALNFEIEEVKKSEVPERSGVVENEAKNMRKSLNLVGGSNVPAPVVKKVKSLGGSEGNFVRLNINGYGRKKFAFKSKRGSFSRTSSRRGKFPSKRKKSGAGDGCGEGEESGVIDEEGVVVDVGVKEDERSKSDIGGIEEAVLRVREDMTDDNLVRLLKLTHGYDSFRDGQLEAIKMVIGGDSTMLVLPTGAGKSLCYQLPALVLEGVTIVVSPLVALMIDQLKQLPPAIQGALLCSSQVDLSLRCLLCALCFARV